MRVVLVVVVLYLRVLGHVDDVVVYNGGPHGKGLLTVGDFGDVDEVVNASSSVEMRRLCLISVQQLSIVDATLIHGTNKGGAWCNDGGGDFASPYKAAGRKARHVGAVSRSHGL